MSLPKLWPPSLRSAFYTCVAIVGWQVGVGKQPLCMSFERLKGAILQRLWFELGCLPSKAVSLP